MTPRQIFFYSAIIIYFVLALVYSGLGIVSYLFPGIQIAVLLMAVVPESRMRFLGLFLIFFATASLGEPLGIGLISFVVSGAIVLLVAPFRKRPFLMAGIIWITLASALNYLGINHEQIILQQLIISVLLNTIFTGIFIIVANLVLKSDVGNITIS